MSNCRCRSLFSLSSFLALPLLPLLRTYTKIKPNKETHRMLNNRLNRRQVLQLAAAPAAAALASCTVPMLPLEESSMASDPPPPDTENVTISHWRPFSTGHRDAVEALKEQFEEQNDGLIIDVVPVSWTAYWDHLSARSAEGDPPDTYRIPMGLARKPHRPPPYSSRQRTAPQQCGHRGNLPALDSATRQKRRPLLRPAR